MELREIYTQSGKPTGRIVPKRALLLPGDFFLHAVIILKTLDGRYIMQQRSLKSRYYAGKWDVTGGGVTAGETTRHAAAREAMEELGVQVDECALRHFLRETQLFESGVNGIIVDIWAARVDIAEKDIHFSEREVNAVKLVSFAEFAETVMYNKSEAFRDVLKRIDAEV